MSFSLTQGEEMVKSRNYGTGKQGGLGGGKLSMTMTVTNKRIINTTKGKKASGPPPNAFSCSLCPPRRRASPLHDLPIGLPQDVARNGKQIAVTVLR